MKKIFLLFAAVAACVFAFGEEGGTLTVLMNELDDIEVVAQRVQQTSSNHEVLDQATLNRDNTGQNLPYLLMMTPALQVTSDDGLGIGYSYFRLRGTSHTRINVTVNDVPLNDQESQTVFWVNMTDLASSTTSIDVQRGVGTSTNGSASFGGSLNMWTEKAHLDTLNRFSLAFNGGMYNTFREMASAHVVFPKMEKGRFAMNARFSKVNSDGFLYRATSDLYSYFGDLGYYGDKTNVILSVFGGNEKTGMAWDGVDYKTAYGIDGADRRYNPAGEYTVKTDDGRDSTVYYDNQTDNYAQQHVHLHVGHSFNRNWSLNATLFYTHGASYYEQYKNKKFSYFGLEPYVDDEGNKVKKAYALYRKYLGSHFYGALLSSKFVSEPVDLQIGLSGTDYLNDHFGTLPYINDAHYGGTLPVNYEYYRNVGRKTDMNLYSKVNWRIINRRSERLTFYGDLQYRVIRYTIDGLNDEDMSPIRLEKLYHFFNPKAGLTYENGGHMAYATFAIANREPSRSNFTENIHMEADGSFSGNMPEPERLYDYELGYTYSHRRFAIGANLYFMDYDNQLVLTGDYNDVGAMSTRNVEDSYRMGIEVTAGVQITNWFRWDGNIVLSRNKILNYEQLVDIYDENYEWLRQETWFFKETTIAFSPMITAASLFTFDYKGFTAGIQTNVVSKQYLDNTMHESASLKPFTTTNLNLQYALPIKQWCSGYTPDIRLRCQVNNVFNAKYASNGGADASYLENGVHPWPWYYAQAGINVHAGFVVDF